jgi:hypothetical protein
MKTESGFGGGWWKADNNFPKNSVSLNSILRIISNRTNNKNFFKEKGKELQKTYTFLMGNQAFNCKKVKKLFVLLKIAEFSPKTQLLYPW